MDPVFFVWCNQIAAKIPGGADDCCFISHGIISVKVVEFDHFKEETDLLYIAH